MALKMSIAQLLLGLLLQCYLPLAAAQENQVERRYACWGSVGPPVVSAQCPRNTIIQVTRAGLKVQNKAGSQCEFSEDDCGCTTETPGCQMPDVDHLCMGKSACRLDVTQQYIDTGICQGFSDYMFIEYKCVQAADETSKDICITSSLQQSSGFIKSPNYPNTYPDNRHCECTLMAMADATINFDILDLQLADSDCQNDEVTLEYNGQVTKLCGQSSGLRDRIITRSQEVTVNFHSDGTDGDNGFWMKYEAKPQGPVKINCVATHKPERVSVVHDMPQQVNIDIELEVDPHPNDLDQATISNYEDVQTTTTEALLTVSVPYENQDRIEEDRQNFEDIIYEEQSNQNMENILQEEPRSENNMEKFSKEQKDDNYDYAGDDNEITEHKMFDRNMEVAADNSDSQSFPSVGITENVQFNEDNVSLTDSEQADNDINDRDITEKNVPNRLNTENSNVDRESIQDTRSQVVRINNNQQDNLVPVRVVAPVAIEEVTSRRSQHTRPVPRQRQTRPQRRNEIQFHQRQNRQRILNADDENEVALNIDKDVLIRDRGNRADIREPYDRMSFERDMFEEYTNKVDPPDDMSNQNRQEERSDNMRRSEQRYIQRPQPVPRQRFNLRPRFEQTTINEQRPRNEVRTIAEQIQPRQRFEQRTRHQQRIFPDQRPRLEQRARTEQRSRAEQRSRFQLPNRFRISSQRANQLPKEIPIPQRKEKAMNSNLKDNSNPKKAPWWWQFTAKNNNKPVPTKLPTDGSILNDKMKIAMYESNVKEKETIESKKASDIPSKTESTNYDNIEVPSDNNADNIMVNDENKIQTGLLEGEKQEETEPEEKKDSITITATAVGIIAMIVLIVVVGVVVRWVLNKREQKRVLRHRHKKECAMRQQHLRQSSSKPTNIR